jgi:hypothetical protein
MWGNEDNLRLLCVDADGKEHIGQSQSGAATEHSNLALYAFDVDPAKVKTLELQSRHYNKRVTAHNVCLDPDHPTTAQLVIDAK